MFAPSARRQSGQAPVPVTAHRRGLQSRKNCTTLVFWSDIASTNRTHFWSSHLELASNDHLRDRMGPRQPSGGHETEARSSSASGRIRTAERTRSTPAAPILLRSMETPIRRNPKFAKCWVSLQQEASSRRTPLPEFVVAISSSHSSSCYRRRRSRTNQNSNMEATSVGLRLGERVVVQPIAAEISHDPKGRNHE